MAWRKSFVNRLDEKYSGWHLMPMDNKHPHAAAIDRIGRKKVQDHYHITDRTIQLWRANGIPKMHWNAVIALAGVNGVQVPEIEQ